MRYGAQGPSISNEDPGKKVFTIYGSSLCIISLNCSLKSIIKAVFKKKLFKIFENSAGAGGPKIPGWLCEGSVNTLVSKNLVCQEVVAFATCQYVSIIYVSTQMTAVKQFLTYIFLFFRCCVMTFDIKFFPSISMVFTNWDCLLQNRLFWRITDVFLSCIPSMLIRWLPDLKIELQASGFRDSLICISEQSFG